MLLAQQNFSEIVQKQIKTKCECGPLNFFDKFMIIHFTHKPLYPA